MFPAVETLVLRLGLRADSGNARANMPNKPNTGYALSIRRKYVRRAAAPAPPRALPPRPASPRRAQQLGVCTCSPTYRQVKKGSWDRRLTSHECRALESSSARSCRRESPRPFRFSVPIGVATSRRRLSHRGVRQESSPMAKAFGRAIGSQLRPTQPLMRCWPFLSLCPLCLITFSLCFFFRQIRKREPLRPCVWFGGSDDLPPGGREPALQCLRILF